MNEKNRNLVLRAASALILLPAVLFLIWKGGIPLALLVGTASAIVASELYGMAGLPLLHPASFVGMIASASMAWFGLDLDERWGGVIAVLAATPLLSLALLTLMPPDGDLKRAAPLAAFAALGPPYAGLCLAAIVALREVGGESNEGFWWIFVALAVTWGNDTGGYFAGRFLGRNKLYPLVSPAKTWEGFWGGMVAAIGLCFVIRATVLPGLRVEDCLLLGGVASVLGPIGDLAESMLKRAFGVKDSGNVIPGHGGLYDRIDALLFNAPWVFAYAYFLRHVV